MHVRVMFMHACLLCCEGKRTCTVPAVHKLILTSCAGASVAPDEDDVSAAAELSNRLLIATTSVDAQAA